MSRPIIYVAGRYRARTYFGIALNIFRAWNAARKLWKAGYIALCPHLNTLWMSEWPVSTPADVFLDGDIALLAACDAIVMLPGWEKSAGARGEHFYAIEHHKAIYYDLDKLI